MKQRNPITLAVVLILLQLSSSAQHGTGSVETKDPFIGAWRLVSLEEPGPDEKVQKVDCSGLLVYTRDGHMSVQVMYRNPPPEKQSRPVQYAQAGYEASFGKYQINDAHMFTFHVEGALVRALIGQNLKRVYELSGDKLVVTSLDPNEHWKVTWERYEPK